MVLVVDNYDSFTYNLVHLVARDVEDVRVFRNDKITAADISELKPQGILLSPGPGRPSTAGVCNDIVDEFGAITPILGVCLGHQVIAERHGATITHAPTLMHGKTSRINHDGEGVFQGLEQNFVATRYHSLVVDPESLPRELLVTATASSGVIMGIRHKTNPIVGIQFHPESVLTVEGPALIRNWIASTEKVRT